MKKFLKIILISLILTLGYYSVMFEPNNLKIEEITIAIKSLPSEFEGREIVQLSDLHSLWFGSREKRVLKILEEIKPNLVFITGDFVDPITKAITDRNLNSVKIFWQKLGEKYRGRIFGVLGNHDTTLVKDYLSAKGIKVLDNEQKKIFFGQDYIYLIGVNDPWTGRDNLPKAMEGIERDIPKILLAHGPEIIDKAKKEKIDLVLVGHTHGGQVNLPLFGRLIQPLSEYGRKYTSGLFKIDSTYLYVNRGVGTSVFPIRFLCQPEITLIKLKSR